MRQLIYVFIIIVILLKLGYFIVIENEILFEVIEIKKRYPVFYIWFTVFND